MQKTSDLEQFVFRQDNRKIRQDHLNDLVESIKACNLLEMRPILVNQRMEVIDGQHRLLAAKELGIPIYYTVEKEISCHHMRTLNLSKSWNDADYLNYYVQNDYAEYKKLKEFITRQSLRLAVALHLSLGTGHGIRKDFRDGKFVFSEEFTIEQLDACKDTIDTIKRNNGHSAYLESGRFWKALITVVKHPSFHMEKWLINLNKMCTRFSCKATMADYLKLITGVYNWRNNNKIHLTEEDLCDT